MPIKITQPGEAKAAAQAGAIIGKGKRAEEERARGEREQARAQQIAAQQSARAAALEWEQQKMLLNSQQDFAHEMRMRQADLEKEARAKEWATEKMEMASRFDFEQDEKERIRDNAEFDAGDKTITESDMPDSEKPRARFKNAMLHPNAKGAAEYFGFKEETDDKPPYTPAQLLAAQKQLAKMPEEPGWARRAAGLLPGIGPGGPTEQQAEVAAYIQKQIDATIQYSNIKDIRLTTETGEGPIDEEEFRREVGRLKATNPEAAATYYNTYGAKFGYK